MAQFARPDGNITQTSFTGGFAEIDEASYSDSDFAYGANNTAAELEVSLTNVTDPQASTGHTFRYRIAKTNAGTVDGAGSAVTITARLMQGTTQIATDSAKTADGTWTQYAYTLTAGEADAITDYTDLRLEFVTSASGGSPANRRGGAVSWAELEVPDSVPTEYTDSATISLKLTPSGIEDLFHQGELHFDIATGADDAGVSGTAVTYPPPSGSYGSSTTTTTWLEKYIVTGTYYITLSLLRFDTSAIPDNATVLAAKLRFNVVNRTDSVDARSVTAGYYSWTPPMTMSDYTSTVETDAHAGTRINVLAIGSNDLDLIGLTNINKTGYTGLRLHLSGGQPTTYNVVEIATFEHSTLPQPQLIITYAFVDADTAYVDLQPSGTDEYTPGGGGGTEYTDSATIAVDLEASSVELAEYIESATISLLLAPSSDEYTTHEYPDSDTAYVDLQPTTEDIAEYTEAATVPLTLTPSGTDEYTAGGGPTQTGVDRVALTGQTPATRTDHYLHVICSITNNAHDGVMRFQLYEGSTAIGTVFETDALTTTPTEFSFHLADADAEDITDYSNLAVEFYGYSANGDPTEFHLHEIWLEIPASTGVEYTDSATIYVALTPTSDELAEYVDADTVLVDLDASSVEERISEDADTVYVELDASGVEYITHEYLDSADIYFDLQVESAELAEYVDAATIYADLTASGTDEISYTYVDAETIPIDLDAASVEYAEYVEAQTIHLIVTPSAQDILEAVDAATLYLDIEPSGAEYIEHAYLDAETIPLDLSTSAVEYAEFVDAAEIYADLAASGTDVTDYVEEYTVYVELDTSSVEEREQYDAETIPLTLLPTSIDVAEFVDAATIDALLTPSGTDLADFVEEYAIYLDLEGSGTDEYTPAAYQEYLDSDTIYLELLADSVEERISEDAESILLTLTPTTTDIAEFVDAAETYLTLLASSVELTEYAEAETVYLDLDTSSVEFAEYVDQASIDLLLAPTAVEAFEAVDEATTYLVLTASGSELLVLAPQIGVPDGDVTAANWQVAPLWPKISDSSGATYIYATAS